MKNIKMFEDFGKEEILENDPFFKEEEDTIDEAANPILVTSKDIMRIKDILTKAAGNLYKAQRLAETMAKLIQDKYKALRRARAAEREGQADLADVFFQRALDLGA